MTLQAFSFEPTKPVVVKPKRKRKIYKDWELKVINDEITSTANPKDNLRDRMVKAQKRLAISGSSRSLKALIVKASKLQADIKANEIKSKAKLNAPHQFVELKLKVSTELIKRLVSEYLNDIS